MFDTIKSVVLYLGLFGISLLLFSTSEQQISQRDGHRSGGLTVYRSRVLFPHLYSIIAIFLLCLIAALRANSVGVDTSVYPERFMQIAASSPTFFDFISNPLGPSNEPLGAALVWLCSRFTTEKALLLFCYQLLTVAPVYAAVVQLRDRISMPIGMAVYLFFFYNNSLNMMRQSMACAFLLLAFAFLMKKGKIDYRFIVCSVIAMLLHNSGVYGFVMLVIASLIGRLHKRSLRVLLYVLIAEIPLFLNQVVQMLLANDIGDSQMQTYADIFINHTFDKSDWFVSPLSTISVAYLVMYSWLVFLPPLLESLLGTRGSIEKAPENNKLWFYLRTMNISGYLVYLVMLLSMQTMYGIRFSIFFDYMLIVSLALSSRGSSAQLRKLVILASLVAIWFVWIIVLGWSGSQTYLFFFE